MTLDPGRFAATHVALWAAHDIADHVVQTDHQAAGKATSWRCMTGHVTGYGVTQIAALGLLRAAGVRYRPGRVLAGLALSLGTHTLLDRRWPVVWLLERTGSARFARAVTPPHRHGMDGDGRMNVWSDEGSRPLPLHGPYLADQSLHHVCVVLAAAVIASS